ncbi:hypothetical protein Taro_007602 [Colocasia esculenta]|uniref:Expansin-like B1 n=1 Tax=Colocasia esculenta TaxID=4460 RepID=A0A843TRS7_COLES|nr:hypothetical protein [Colocasia esculenta]
MGLATLLLALLLPGLCSSLSDFTSSRTTFYGSPECQGNPHGACGYGEFGKVMNGGDVGAVGKLYRGGSGCGACYQIKCTHPELCKEEGVGIVVTDHGYSGDADFVLSAQGFAKLSRPNMAPQLMAYGGIDIQYRRVPCKYPGYNLTIKIKEQSSYPHYLAFVFIHQGGQKDILAVEVWQEDCKQWRPMRRAYGGVFDVENPPEGPLPLRLQVRGEDGGEQSSWVQLNNVIPADWKAGAAYDTAVQLS